MVMKDVRDATARILDQTSLADILKRVELAVEGKDALNYAQSGFFCFISY